MWAFRIVKDQVFSDCHANLGNNVTEMQVNLFIFDFPPQPFYENIIAPGSSATYNRQVIARNHREAWKWRFLHP
jgi:hypothetical protein